MRTLEDLCHVTRTLPTGGEIIVIDTAAAIKPEVQAMMAARFSRWNKPLVELIESSLGRNAETFLDTNYQAGYGHKSIGELGEAVAFVGGVSMLCAKAIQDFPLYRGQESSTRYIDFSNQPFLNPHGTDDGRAIQENWRAFYLRGTSVVIPHLTERFSRKEGESEVEYAKAIKARAFDIMRAFLPAGATTNVAWVGDFRHMNDHLADLRYHPLHEVRDMDAALESALAEKYPSSFNPEKRYPNTERYLEDVASNYLYFEGHGLFPEFCLARDTLDSDLLVDYWTALTERPPKTELPWGIRECGQLRFDYLLDFGSFRDLQRQRALIVPMPLLTAKFGFEPWYYEQLPAPFAEEARSFVERQLDLIDQTLRKGARPISKYDLQYYLPMGLRVPIRQTGDLRGLVYMLELRSTRFVHPTLVRRVLQQAEVLHQRLSTAVQLHLDPEPFEFDVRRAKHDFVQVG